MTQTASRAIALLSAASIGGLCAASLAPAVDCAGIVSEGRARTAGSAGRDQELYRDSYQRALYSSGGSRRRQRPTNSQDGERPESHVDNDVPPSEHQQQHQGMFNSFSLEEQEPSCYFKTTSPLRSTQAQRQDQHEASSAGADAGFPSPDRYNPEMDRDLHCNDAPFHASDENYAEFGPAPGHYYPGRGRNAAQSLLFQGQDFPSSYSLKNSAVPSSSSYLRHRHQPYLFNGGNNPYSSSSSAAGGAVSRRRRRSSSDGVMTRSSPFPRLSPAMRANAAAAATALVKIASAAAVALSVLLPLAAALSSHWAYFVAGGICAAISHTAAVPLDVIKTRIQCAPPGVKYRGTWDALVRICRSEGTRVLFCGAGATLVGYALQGSLKFGFFEFLKPVFAGLFLRRGSAAAAAAAASTTAAPALGTLIAASVTAEIAGSTALTPLEAARIRMVADADYAPGLRSGIARMISEEGVGALTRGLPAVLAKQVPYTVTKLVTFDYLVRSVASRFSNAAGGVGKGRSTGVGVTVACAVVAGVLSSLASQPGDSLLSALNSEGRSEDVSGVDVMSEYNSEDGSSCSGSEEYDGGVYFQASAGEVDDGPWQHQEQLQLQQQQQQQQQQQVEPVARAMLRIAREAGFSGLFRGTGARMMHVTSIVTVQLLIYQSIKSMVGIAS